MVLWLHQMGPGLGRGALGNKRWEFSGRAGGARDPPAPPKRGRGPRPRTAAKAGGQGRSKPGQYPVKARSNDDEVPVLVAGVEGAVAVVEVDRGRHQGGVRGVDLFSEGLGGFGGEGGLSWRLWWWSGGGVVGWRGVQQREGGLWGVLAEGGGGLGLLERLFGGKPAPCDPAAAAGRNPLACARRRKAPGAPPRARALAGAPPQTPNPKSPLGAPRRQSPARTAPPLAPGWARRQP